MDGGIPPAGRAHAARVGRSPVAQATDRVRLLAAHHASVASSDWRRLTTVLPMVLPRGR
ncbi:hypothetical protein GTS_43620 [Gandjariella thermophila]|uniref:Uncharacterized protein n=1 Tax=Gandjariella thermophila TaxID=1931992 RepID=A0A4D4JEF9_9PSEU|nr:hypothetical protein GTS_43620 [Gandjariella thermophila]